MWMKVLDIRGWRIHKAASAALVISLIAMACNFGQPVPEPVGITPATSTVAVTAEAIATVEKPEARQAATATSEPLAVPVVAEPSAVPALAEPSPTPFVDRAENPPTAEAVTLAPQAEKLTTPDVVKILKPSVVQVVTETLAMNMFNQPVPSQGVGTGIVLNNDGHIMTNNHVVSGAQRITVIFENGESREAELVGNDFQTDLAVIRVEADGLELRPAKLGISADLQVGEDVIAIGHALGLPGGPTVSKGVVSALNRSIDTDSSTTIVDLIQTDAEINPGNSGGALVNDQAEVIGINTAIIQSGRGIGFAINIDDAKIVVSQLMERGYVVRGFVGISPVNVTPGLASRFDLPVTKGILVGRVIAGTAAADIGLQVEDIIVQLGDSPILNTGELSKFLIAHQPGETVEVVYYRGDEEMRDELTLGGRP